MKAAPALSDPPLAKLLDVTIVTIDTSLSGASKWSGVYRVRIDDSHERAIFAAYLDHRPIQCRIVTVGGYLQGAAFLRNHRLSIMWPDGPPCSEYDVVGSGPASWISEAP